MDLKLLIKLIVKLLFEIEILYVDYVVILLKKISNNF